MDPFALLGTNGIIILVLGATFLGMGWYIKHQRSLLDGLRAEQIVWVGANDRLAKSLKDQNEKLLAGEKKYNDAQTELNVAKGINMALSTEFGKLRTEWKNRPVPTTCAGAVQELKNTISPTAARFNKK
jgi:hypothetical protein